MSRLIEQRLSGGEARRPAAAPPPADLDGALARLRQAMLERVEPGLLGARGEAGRRQLRERLGALAGEALRDVSAVVRMAVIDRLIDEVMGYGPIQPLMEDPEVTDVMVNGPDQVYYARDGVIRKADVRFESAEQIKVLIDRICAPIGRRVDESAPMVDARLPDGSRVNATIPPVSPDSPTITIRKFGRRLTLEELVSLGTVPRELVPWLSAVVRGRCNIVVSGGAGSGKTTLLNCLSSFIPSEERIITIEDTLELQLQQPHVVRMEARPPNIEGKGAVTIRDLVVNALRQNPTRIIVGEVRAEEAWDMLQAMNTGHPGSMTTVHANSPHDAMLRLFACVEMAGVPEKVIWGFLRSAVELVVQVERFYDGSRKLVSVCQVAGEDMEPLWEWDGERLRRTGVAFRFEGKLRRHGVSPPGVGA
ncbi:MAG: CpaF family protein [Bacillota bacterium]